jgi:hypothetical protein
VSIRISATDLEEELVVAADLRVAPHRVDDVGVDVVLGRAGLVVRRGLLAVDCAPCEQRAALAELSCALARLRQHAVPEAEEVAGDARLRVGQERQHVDLGVPEVVALVRLPGESLRGNPRALRPPRRLGDLEEVPADRLLDALGLLIGLDPNVGAVPEVVELLALPALEARVSRPAHTVQRLRAALDELGRGHLPRRLIRDELRQPERHAGRCLRAHDHGAAVGRSVGLDTVG